MRNENSVNIRKSALKDIANYVIVWSISAAIEGHFKRMSQLEAHELSEQKQLMLKEKRAEFEARENGETGSARMTLNQGAATATAGEDTGYPASASLSFKCHTKAMVFIDGCQTCLACGCSKCG